MVGPSCADALERVAFSSNLVHAARVRWLGSLILIVLLNARPAAANPALQPPTSPAPAARLRFDVTVTNTLLSPSLGGRLLVIAARTNLPEPRLQIGPRGFSGPVIAGRDAPAWVRGKPISVGREHAVFPLRHFDDLPAGEHWIQAVLITNRDLRLPDAPGNLVSSPQRVRLDVAARRPVTLVLDRQLPEPAVTDTPLVRHLKIRSDALSRFWGRDMFLRAAVILPRTHAESPTRRYPLLVDIGGFGSRSDRFDRLINDPTPFRTNWLAYDTPQFVVLALDGAGPLGDPYWVNSDNNGPWGDALVRELIPHVEQEFRGIGHPWARFTTGGSTGGWVSLALQIFYPDYFGGCWSGFPDAVDFRAVQLIDLYADTNAYVNAAGFERPSERTRHGDVKYTMRHDVQFENVLGDGDDFATGGGQWGAWAATFGLRGAEGRPLPPWNPRTGEIDPAVRDAWRRYDLRHLLAEHWPILGPRLRGKLHIWVAGRDEFFLNQAAEHLETFLRDAQPAAEAQLTFGPREGHGWQPKPWVDLLREMQRAVEAGARQPAEAAREALFRSRLLHGPACPHCKGGR
jgi:S-formylglutathione hydrolase FrmB